LNISVPNAVRYLRGNELLPSQRSAKRTPRKKSAISQLQVETKEPIPVPALATNNQLLNRAKVRIDASVIRRPPRRLIRNITHETIVSLAVYG
jgi:hypothetical protein